MPNDKTMRERAERQENSALARELFRASTIPQPPFVGAAPPFNSPWRVPQRKRGSPRDFPPLDAA